MNLATNRLARVLLQFQRKTLWIAAVAAGLGIALSAFLKPTHTRGGAIVLAISASVLASLIVAAIALERATEASEFQRAGVTNIFVDRLSDIPVGAWTKLLAGATKHFRVLGTSNHGYLNSDDAKNETEAALRSAVRRKHVKVEFLWLPPDGELAKLREEEEGERTLRADGCEAIMFFYELRSKLEDKQPERVSLREYKSLPTCGITWADDSLVVTHYLAGRLNLRAPGLVLNSAESLWRRAVGAVWAPAHARPPLAEAYIKNYNEVASDGWSTDITPERLEEIRAFHASLTDQGGKRSESQLRNEEPDERIEPRGDDDGE
jgi:hypothetical protein